MRSIVGATSSYVCSRFHRKSAIVCLLALTLLPGAAVGEILWSGSYESGDFKQWHTPTDSKTVTFPQVPAYGRPIQYGGQHTSHVGDGSLLSLVTSPVRVGKYAAKFTVKNSQNGVEPDDCDLPAVCTRRRSELTAQGMLPHYYNAMPYMSERWLSVSIYVPSNWDNSGSGWGNSVFQVKPLNDGGGIGPNLQFHINGGSWIINHRWTDIEDFRSALPWQQVMFYSGNHKGRPYPNANDWPDGLADFPDVAASHAALRSINKGGWTDWVIHTKFDARGSKAGGTGFLTIWKREDSGPWVKVLHILPKVTTRGGLTFDHGIGFNSPAKGSNPGGFGIKAGLYMHKDQVWGLSQNRVVYNDNIKVGSHRATFASMSPDGSSPGFIGDQQPPKPPAVTVE